MSTKREFNQVWWAVDIYLILYYKKLEWKEIILVFLPISTDCYKSVDDECGYSVYTYRFMKFFLWIGLHL